MADGDARVVVGEGDGDAFLDGGVTAVGTDGVGEGLEVAFSFCVRVAPTVVQLLLAICVGVGVGVGVGEAVVLVGEGEAAAAGSASPPPQPDRTTTVLSASAPRESIRRRTEGTLPLVIVDAVRLVGKTGIDPPWTKQVKMDANASSHRLQHWSSSGVV